MEPNYDLEINEFSPEGRRRLRSLHWMAYPLPNGRAAVDLTGVALVDLVGDSTWNRQTLRLRLNSLKAVRLLPEPPNGRIWHLRPEMWSVSAAPAAVFNRNTAKNAGWAVDTCNTQWDLGVTTSDGDLLHTVDLYLDVATSDTDGILHRISFDFRGVGRLTDRAAPDIEAR
ncbi:MAG: hypothetical protein AAGA65_26960 [Actinomycetota bacterium]